MKSKMANRLTYKTPDGKAKPVKSIDETVYNKNGYLVAGSRLVEKLADYEGVEEQGRLFTAPVAVGGTIWRAVHGGIKDYVVRDVKFGDNGLYRLGTNARPCLSSRLGMDWWLTREEALKASCGQAEGRANDANKASI